MIGPALQLLLLLPLLLLLLVSVLLLGFLLPQLPPRSPNPPIAVHPSRGSCSTGSTTHSSRDKVRTACPRPFRHAPHANRAPEGAPPNYGTNGQLRMASPRPFRHMPHTGRAPQGAPPAASVGVFTRVHRDYWAPPSHGPCSTRSSARLRTFVPQQPPYPHCHAARIT